MKVNQSMSSLQELFQLIYLKEIYENKSGSNVLLFLSEEIGFNDDVLVYGLLRCIRKFYMGSLDLPSSQYLNLLEALLGAWPALLSASLGVILCGFAYFMLLPK